MASPSWQPAARTRSFPIWGTSRRPWLSSSPEDGRRAGAGLGRDLREGTSPESPGVVPPIMDGLIEVEGPPAAIEAAIRATGLPRSAFTADALIDFVRRYEPR